MAQAQTVTDKRGRKITLRPHPDVLLTWDILEAAGQDAKGRPTEIYIKNDRLMGFATLACYVSDIDGVPVPMPAHIGQIKALVGQLGDDGIEAISKAIQAEATVEVNVETAKNSVGTPL
jgi:hypothetical protein